MESKQTMKNTSENEIMLQQGDVMLKRIGSLPEGCTSIPGKILQLGEVTGHKHQFAEDAPVEIYVAPEFAGAENSITPDEGKFVVVSEGEVVMLTHEEHKPVVVEPGVYQVDIVREFDYDTMEESRVVD